MNNEYPLSLIHIETYKNITDTNSSNSESDVSE